VLSKCLLWLIHNVVGSHGTLFFTTPGSLGPIVLGIVVWVLGAIFYAAHAAQNSSMLPPEDFYQQVQELLRAIPLPKHSPNYAYYRRYYFDQYREYVRSYNEAAAESFGNGMPSFSWPVFLHCIGFGASLFAVVLALYEYQYGTLSILVEMCEEKWASVSLQRKASSNSAHARCAAKASKDVTGAGTSASRMSQNKDSKISGLDLHRDALQICKAPKQKKDPSKSGSELVKVGKESSSSGSAFSCAQGNPPSNQFARSPSAPSLSTGTLETQGLTEEVCSPTDTPEMVDLSHAQKFVRANCNPSEVAKSCASLAATAEDSDTCRESFSMGSEESSFADSVDVTDLLHGVDAESESINGRVAISLQGETVHVQKHEPLVVSPPPGLEPLCEPPPGLERLGPLRAAGLVPVLKAREIDLPPVPGDLDALSTDELIALLRQEGVLNGLDQRGVPVRAHLLRCLRLLSKPPASKPREGATAEGNTMQVHQAAYDSGHQGGRLRADAPAFTPSLLGFSDASAILPSGDSEFLDDFNQPLLVGDEPASYGLQAEPEAGSMPVVPSAPGLWDKDACMHMEALTRACWYAVHAFASADPDPGVEAHVRRVVNHRKTRRRARSTSGSSRCEDSKVGSWLALETWPTLEAARHTTRQATNCSEVPTSRPQVDGYVVS